MSIVNHNSRLAGFFKIERYQNDENGNEIPGTREVVAPWQENLILDSGLDNLGETSWMRKCVLGAGSAAPLPTDTQLGSPLGSVNITNTSLSDGPYEDTYSSVVGEWVFSQGVATGVISEIGVGPITGPLTTRALIRDENGDPTTITKGPIDSLTVTYQIRVYRDIGDSAYQVTNPHTSTVYDVVSRPIGSASNYARSWHTSGPVMGGSNGSMFASTDPLDAWDSPHQTTDRSGSADVADYLPGSHYRESTVTWNEGSGNLSGGIVRVGTSSSTNALRIQASFDPPIDKDNTKTLRITFRHSWGRYEP